MENKQNANNNSEKVNSDEVYNQKTSCHTKLDLLVNSLYSTCKVIQTFKNETTKNLELSINFPVLESFLLVSFAVKYQGKLVHSKVIEKQKAEEKYSDAIASGNTALIGLSNKDKSYTISIGQFLVNESLELTSEFVQIISSEDKSYKFSFDTQILPSFFSGNRKLDSQNTFSEYQIKLSSESRLTRLISRTHFLTTKFSNDNKSAEIQITAIKERDLIEILFRTEGINKAKLYEEYDPKLQVFSYAFQFMLDQRDNSSLVTDNLPDLDSKKNYYEMIETNAINDAPGVFIFLIDQSGSMSGQSIKIAKEALALFIKSLPENSYFDIYGFGSSFNNYTNGPQPYETQNVETAVNKVLKLEADLGGTNIYSPLANGIFKAKYHESLMKHILMITDGEVDDPEIVYSSITKNIKNFRFHSIGIGSSFDRNFIINSAKYGKGTYNFATNLEDLNKMVIKSLNNALRPYYNNVKTNIMNGEKEITGILSYPNVNDNKMICNDEIFTSFLISEEKLTDFFIRMNYFNPETFTKAEKVFKYGNDDLEFIKLEEGNNLNKLIASHVLISKTDNISEDEALKLALKFQVLTEKTSLFVELENLNSNDKETFKVTFVNKNDIPFIGVDKEIMLCSNKASVDMLYCCEDEDDEYEVGNVSCGALAENVSYGAIPGNDSPKSNNKGSYRCFEYGEQLEEIEPECIKLDKGSIKLDSLDSNIKQFQEKEKLEVKSNNELGYFEIINGQETNGRWTYPNGNLTSKELAKEEILNSFSEYFVKLSQKLSTYDKDDIFTILVLFYLYSKFSSKKDEFLLIANKAKKYLSKKGINYDEEIKEF
jgi:hypothetical protein